MWQTH